MSSDRGRLLLPDFRQWARRLELYFEETPVAHILAKLFLIVISVVSIVIDAHDVFGEAWSTPITLWLLLFFFVASLTLDYAHVRLATRRMKEILKRDRHIANLKNVIRRASTLQQCKYRLGEWRICQEIDAEGNSRYTRKVRIEFRKRAVYTMQMIVGAVAGGHPVADIEQLKIVAKNFCDGAPLLWVPTVDTPDRREIVIVLDPPVTEGGEPCSVEVTLNWPGLWEPLIKKYADEGMLRIENRTGVLEMEFYLPSNLRFTSFRIRPDIGSYQIDEDTTGRSCLKFHADKVRRRTYHYQLYCELKKPP